MSLIKSSLFAKWQRDFALSCTVLATKPRCFQEKANNGQRGIVGVQYKWLHCIRTWRCYCSTILMILSNFYGLGAQPSESCKVKSIDLTSKRSTFFVLIQDPIQSQLHWLESGCHSSQEDKVQRTRVVWQPQVSTINTPNSWSLWCKTWKSCACRELETPLGSCTFVEPRYSIIHCPEIGRARSAGFAKSNFKTGFRRGKLWYDMMRLKWLKWPNALLPCASLLVPEHSTCKERLSVDDPVRESDDETNAITRMPTKIRGDPQHFAKGDMSGHVKNYEYIYIYIIYNKLRIYIYIQVCEVCYTRTWISPSLNLYGSQNIGHGVHASDPQHISAVHHIRKKYVNGLV